MDNTLTIVIALLAGVGIGGLGGFLFSRIRQQGVDGRFDTIKPSFSRFPMAWTLQGL